MTGGQYVPLRNANLLAKVIIGSAAEEISLEKLLAEAEKEVKEMQELGINDEEALASHIHTTMVSKGIKAKNLLLNDKELDRPSERAIEYSKMESLGSIRNAYKSASYDVNDINLEQISFEEPSM